MHGGRPIEVGTKIELGYARIVVDLRIGEGAMGVVYRGWLFYAPAGPRASDPPIPLAVKVLHPHALVQEAIRNLFLTEADSLRRLSHPNIVRFHDLFHYMGLLAIAMEFVDGNTLEDVIARHVARARLAGAGALPGMAFKRAWYYFQQLLGALAATHALGIVHRDVKPSNIMVRKDGIVKLTDYGIARLLNQPDPAQAQKGHSGGITFAPGTGAYMSPEQVRGSVLDGRSDLYSAAIVLYEMLAGRLPFPIDGKTELMLRLEQVEKPPPPIRTWLVQAPPVLDALFARALAKDPRARFANAIEMGDAFRRALGLEDTDLWRAQAEMARCAPTRLEAGEGHKMETLRELLIRGYGTQQMWAK
jgi:eukaryotic-like serine/threonine-protein kinase